MLHFHTLSNASEAKAYFRSPDYHFEGVEHDAYWLGKGAEKLGLVGKADPAHFEALIDNQHPLHGGKLTAARRDDRKFARDMTVSIVKSATLAATIGGDARIPRAVERSLAKMFALLEKDAQTRVRKKGADHERVTGNLVACVFPHKTSRPINGQPDPQLHWHVVILNLTYDREEKEWKAVQFRELLRDSGHYNAVFRAYLADELREMGYELRQTKDAFEITGIPERAIKEFSRRTKQVEELAEALDRKIKEEFGPNARLSEEGKAKLGATSRHAKTKGLTWNDLLRLWGERLKPGEMDAIREVVANAREPHRAIINNKAALDWAIAHEFERNSVVPERTLLTTALKHGLTTVTVEGLYEELARHKELIRRTDGGRAMVTTRKVLAEEKAIVAFAIDGRGRCKPLGQSGAKVPDTLKPGEAMPPTRSQAAAMVHLWTSPDRIITWRGFAGAGKTETLKAALEQIKAPYVAVAPSAEASRGQLRRAGLPGSETLTKFLGNEALQEKARNGLIVLDEASMTGAESFAQLTRVAKRVNARILVVGDPAQHKAVAHGDVLKLLQEKAGLPVAVLGEIKRQQRQDYREAVRLLETGEQGSAFHQLDGMGWIEGMQAGDWKPLIDAYVEETKPAKKGQKSREALIIAPTHEVGREIAGQLRERLKAEGRLGEEREVLRLVPLNLTEAERSDARYLPEGAMVRFHRHAGKHKAGDRVRITAENRKELAESPKAFAVYGVETQAVAVGERIRLNAGVKDYTGKKQFDNGAVLDVVGFTPAGNVRVRNPLNREESVLRQDAGHFTQGTVTSHASQSRTVDVALVAMPQATFGAVDAATATVSVSRGRHKALVFTDDKAKLLERWKEEDERKLAMDLVREPRHNLARKMKRFMAFLRSSVSLGAVRKAEKFKVREMERGWDYGR